MVPKTLGQSGEECFCSCILHQPVRVVSSYKNHGDVVSGTSRPNRSISSAFTSHPNLKKVVAMREQPSISAAICSLRKRLNRKGDEIS